MLALQQPIISLDAYWEDSRPMIQNVCDVYVTVNKDWVLMACASLQPCKRFGGGTGRPLCVFGCVLGQIPTIHSDQSCRSP